MSVERLTAREVRDVDQAPAAVRSESFSRHVEGRSIGRYRKGEIVVSQADPADAVFYIERGRVKVSVVSEQGKEAVVAMLETNDFFGEGCLAGQAQRIATVAAMTDSVRLEKAPIVRGGPRRSAVQFEREAPCGCSCCWRTLARKRNPSRSSRKSARRRLWI